MEAKDRDRILEASLARQLAWIAAAESRVSFIFAVDTAMLGVLAGIAPAVGGWTIAPAIAASIAGLAGLGSLICLSLASFPRVTGPKNSLLFFGGIIQRDQSQFEAAMNGLTHEDYRRDLCAQVHRNAEIATRKFYWVRRALQGLYVAILPWAAAVYLIYNGSP